MSYLSWNQKTLTDISSKEIADAYANGYLFGRLGKGVMQQTRSARIDLNKFELSSENRRILKKVEDLNINILDLPLKTPEAPAGGGDSLDFDEVKRRENSPRREGAFEGEYNWKIGKLAKDFYEQKFGADVMTAIQIKEMLTNTEKSNFNGLLTYSATPLRSASQSYAGQGNTTLGYAIIYSNDSILHYSYPFYDLEKSSKDMGLGMMLKAIMHTKGAKLKYIYLGSLQRPGDTYKLQFKGIEWFDGTDWQTDIETVKNLLNTI